MNYDVAISVKKVGIDQNLQIRVKNTTCQTIRTDLTSETIRKNFAWKFGSLVKILLKKKCNPQKSKIGCTVPKWQQIIHLRFREGIFSETFGS